MISLVSKYGYARVVGSRKIPNKSLATSDGADGCFFWP